MFDIIVMLREEQEAAEVSIIAPPLERDVTDLSKSGIYLDKQYHYGRFGTLIA
jgi:hypothetical protein